LYTNYIDKINIGILDEIFDKKHHDCCYLTHKHIKRERICSYYALVAVIAHESLVAK